MAVQNPTYVFTPTESYLKVSGGIFKDMMIHDFDLCRLYLGNDEVKEIYAMSSSFTKLYKKIKDHELAIVTMKTKKGVLCTITKVFFFSWVAK